MADSQVPDYYKNAGVDPRSDSFGNFDDLDNFRRFGSIIRQPDTRNFLVDFGEEAAYCAFNLESPTIESLLKNPVCSPFLYKVSSLFERPF